MKTNWNYHFQKSKEFFHQRDYKKTLEELRVCMKGVEKEFVDVSNLPASEARKVTKRFSRIIYYRTLCFYRVGRNCCARKNIYFAYDQIRSIFLNPSFDGPFRNSLRIDLKNITELYQNNRKDDKPDNLINDFNRIYYTKILL